MKKKCGICGNFFTVRPSHAHLRKHCGFACLSIYKRRNYIGERHHSWRGGRGKSTDGYQLVRLPGISAVKEHILLATAALGKNLPFGAETHHFNGNKMDNSQGNIIVCEDRAYHCLLHRRQKAKLACGNPTWRKCRYCKQWDDPKGMTVCENKLYGDTVYHKNCKRRAYEEKRRGIKVEGLEMVS